MSATPNEAREARESESFTDAYGTRVLIRSAGDAGNVLLVLRYTDDGEPFAYGFTRADFATFAAKCTEIAERLART